VSRISQTEQSNERRGERDYQHINLLNLIFIPSKMCSRDAYTSIHTKSPRDPKTLDESRKDRKRRSLLAYRSAVSRAPDLNASVFFYWPAPTPAAGPTSFLFLRCTSAAVPFLSHLTKSWSKTKGHQHISRTYLHAKPIQVRLDLH